MDYARVRDDNSVEYGLPQNGYMKDGRSVFGYDTLPHETLVSEGWKEYINNIPEYNLETQYLEYAEPTINADSIIANYVIKPVVHVITPEEKIIMLETQIQDLSIALAELKGMGV